MADPKHALQSRFEAIVETISDGPDPYESFHDASELLDLVESWVSAAALARARQAARLAAEEHLTVAQLARRLGVSKARAGQWLLAARDTAQADSCQVRR